MFLPKKEIRQLLYSKIYKVTKAEEKQIIETNHIFKYIQINHLF